MKNFLPRISTIDRVIANPSLKTTPVPFFVPCNHRTLRRFVLQRAIEALIAGQRKAIGGKDSIVAKRQAINVSPILVGVKSGHLITPLRCLEFVYQFPCRDRERTTKCLPSLRREVLDSCAKCLPRLLPAGAFALTPKREFAFERYRARRHIHLVSIQFPETIVPSRARSIVAIGPSRHQKAS